MAGLERGASARSRRMGQDARGGARNGCEGRREEQMYGRMHEADAWAGTKNGQATFTLNGR